jgi:hypothetical protein
MQIDKLALPSFLPSFPVKNCVVSEFRGVGCPVGCTRFPVASSPKGGAAPRVHRWGRTEGTQMGAV